MRVTVLNGSPNKQGTCSFIIREIVDRISDDVEVSRHELNELSIHGCQECFACRSSRTDRCYHEDDLSPVLQEVKTTDCLILASPVFFADLSAQMKCFVDRTWAYFGQNGQSAGHLKRNRRIVFILSYGYGDPGHYDDLLEKYAAFFQMYGFSRIECIVAYGAQFFSNLPSNMDEITSGIDRVSEAIKSEP
jgi:multimeric flavodoxin WrbA